MSTERSAWTDARRAEAEVRHLRALLLSNETLRGQLEDYTKRNVALLAENERLREALEHVIADSPGTPETVKGYLRKALRG